MVSLVKHDDVFVLTMKMGENRFTDDFMKALHNALDEVEKSEGAVALITTSEGKFFSNGLDAENMLANPDNAQPYLLRFMALLARFISLPFPTVAAINGHAFAGGCMLALAHDFRVMRTGRGFMCLNEVDIGLPLCPGMNAVIKCKLNATTYRDAVLKGYRFGAEEALERGMVDVAVPESDLLPKAMAIASSMAPKGDNRETFGSLKREMYKETIALCLEGGLGEGKKLVSKL
eukprot:GILK01002898.1.p1 GENE.GILK01002898.1~~GILK01002898.1.p1  ORF type:complete len:233 (+),score=26.84 GILK01002898.1:49-747(+)